MFFSSYVLFGAGTSGGTGGLGGLFVFIYFQPCLVGPL